MTKAQRPVTLAGVELRDRHVAVLTDGPDDGYQILEPFIADGFAEGDRAFHIVDPASRDAHLDRLSGLGIDVAAATASRQLEVRTWDETYLRGGAFDGGRQFGYIRQALREGRGLGYKVTRLIGSLDWAVDMPDVMSDVIAYEKKVDVLLRPLNDIVLCTYDLRRHSARAIAEVLAYHPTAVVGGVVRTNGIHHKESARDRLVTAASHLFQENGIQATGVDAILESAGVAKATFYRHFPSKDDLVVAWLRGDGTRWFDRVRARAEENHTGMDEVIPRFFEAVGEWLEAEDYRGCPYLNAAVEITDPTHAGRVVIVDRLQEIEDYFTGLVAASGHPDARQLGREIQTLAAGAIMLGVARRSGAPALAARDAARALLAEAARD